MKKINIDDTLHTILEKYPELEDTLYNLGFAGVKNPIMRNTHARVMTLRKGIEHLNIDKNKLKEELEKKGFEIDL